MSRRTISTPPMAIAAGAIVIAGSTIYVISKSGAFFSAQSLLIACIAFGIFAAAYVLGEGRTAGRTTVCLIAALIAAEVFNLANNGERQVMTREEAQAPLRAQRDAHNAAVAAVAKAEADRPASERLARAEAALADLQAGKASTRTEAAQVALEKATAAWDAERYNGGCKSACRDKERVAVTARSDLKTAIDADARDRAGQIAAARAEVAQALAAAEAAKAARIAEAKATLERTPMPPSATALADRLNMSGALLDLLMSVAMSVAVIGLGATLVAHGAGELAREKADAAQSDYPAISAPNAELLALFRESGNSESGIPTNPGKPTPPRGGGRRGRRVSAEIVDFTDRFRERHGRAPSGLEIRAEFPDLARSTAYDYADRCRA